VGTPDIDLNRSDRRLFAAVAWLFPLIIVVGFARTYYLKSMFGTPPLPSRLVQAHGLVMTLWVALFVIQIWLVRAKRVATHRSLGTLGIGLGAALAVTAFFTAVAAAKFGSASTPPGFPPLEFLAVPFFDLVMFIGLFGAAIVRRRRPADHKRLMLLTAVNFLPPALGRIPVPALQALGPVIFVGVPVLLTIGLLIYDRRRTGRMNRAFLAGAIALVLSYPLRFGLSGTDAWHRFAEWLTAWAA
jgi:hypothetical protein